jgi:hypothetical protein
VSPCGADADAVTRQEVLEALARALRPSENAAFITWAQRETQLQEEERRWRDYLP